MEEWITANEIPLGRSDRRQLFDLLKEHAAFALDAFSDGLGFLIDGPDRSDAATPALVLVALLRSAPAYWPDRSVGFVALISVSPCC